MCEYNSTHLKSSGSRFKWCLLLKPGRREVEGFGSPKRIASTDTLGSRGQRSRSDTAAHVTVLVPLVASGDDDWAWAVWS